MQKIYYIVENDNPVGPFTPQELKSHGLSSQSRIYVMGWSEFRTACDIPELASYLAQTSASPEEASVEGATVSKDSSEKELLLRILSHLDELQRENRELRQEIESMRGQRQTQASAPSTPPPFNPEMQPAPFSPKDNIEEEAEKAEAKRKWNEEWDKASIKPMHTPKKKSSGGYGCLVFAIILLVIGILLFISYVMHSAHSAESAVEADSTPVYYDYVEPAPEAAVEADDWDVASEYDSYNI